MLKTTVHSPWGARQPDPNFDRSMKIYELALTTGLRSPFVPPDELHPDAGKTEESKTETAKADTAKADASKTDTNKSDESKPDKSAADKKTPAEVKIDFTDLPSRLTEVPAPPGNYSACRPPTSASAGSTRRRARAQAGPAVPRHRQQGRRTGHRHR